MLTGTRLLHSGHVSSTTLRSLSFLPAVKPLCPDFSSGPCKKRPGWSLHAYKDAALGRSHRSKLGKAKLKEAIELTREILRIPADYRIGIVPASDTGAYEMAMWSMLGERPGTRNQPAFPSTLFFFAK